VRISLEKTDVSEVRTTSFNTLMMEIVRASETSVYSNETPNKTLIFMYAYFPKMERRLAGGSAA
jgi:hypothetical protein